jgi:His/Glu/Gln/Arg/opine family amino acid ABC transporter permease subunit
MPFSFEYVISILPSLLQGTVVTVEVTLAGMLGANICGLAVAVIRWLGWGPLKLLCNAYVELTRNTPFLVFVFFVYFGLPAVGIGLGTFPLGVLILSFYFGAFLAEVYRGAMQSIGRGQWEAGAILSLTDLQIMRIVVLPQAIRVSLPGVVNYLIGTFKDSSYLAYITLQELMYHARYEGAQSFRVFEAFLSATAIYLVISYPVSLVARELEKRVKRQQAIEMGR